MSSVPETKSAGIDEGIEGRVGDIYIHAHRERERERERERDSCLHALYK